ncbi:restriction endonuclease subunit S [Nocardia sp. NPDC058633]|uniref:restriction endonuclease subunit S n=1 Tax=Nocardia sp. NPDC058633 TaxID=3346568 RepID=UPI003649C96B
MTLLGEVALVIDCEHKTAPRSESETFGYSIGTGAVRDGRILLEKAKPVNRSTYGQWTRRAIPALGDLIFSREAPMGEVGAVPADAAVCLGQRTVLLRPAADRVTVKFLKYALQAPDSQQWIQRNSAGSTVKHLNVGDVRKLPLPYLPSLVEQHRIVEVLEDHLSRLDAAQSYIDISDRRSNILEQAVLANCREGEIYPLGEISEIQGGIQKQPKRAPQVNHYPFLRVANVGSGTLDLADIHRVELFGNELEKLSLRQGDLLVVEGNGSPSQIGRAAIWDESIENAVHQNHLIRVRPGPSLLPEYLEAVWNSPQNRRILTDVSSSSSGLHTLSVAKLKKISIPVPSLERQAGLVVQVARSREVIDRIRLATGHARTRTTTLRRALLASAFSGRLIGDNHSVGVLANELVPA